MPSKQVERGRDEPQHAGKDKRGSDRFARRKPDDEQERGYGKAPATDPRQSHSQSDEETYVEVDDSARSEKVWIPHSSFLPLQRPDLGLLGSSGMAVHGWQPMLEYPEDPNNPRSGRWN